jgi:hypothetical protein
MPQPYERGRYGGAGPARTDYTPAARNTLPARRKVDEALNLSILQKNRIFSAPDFRLSLTVFTIRVAHA